MNCPCSRLILGLAVPLLLPLSSPRANPDEDVTPHVVEWAYGWLVDSVTVKGNKNTKDFVILREMETQPGHRLDEVAIQRDIRFVSDLSPLASAHFRADSLSPGHCAIRITVSERPVLLMNSILPVVNYDFETGFTYGIRWSYKNFRGRLEQLNLKYERNEQQDESASFSWSAPWLGWKHISIGAGVNYFRRGELPDEVETIESSGVSGFLALPLTESRISFSQLRGSLSLSKRRKSSRYEPATINETFVSPIIGYWHDSRDSPIKPANGIVFAVDLQTSFPEGKLDEGVSHWIRNDLRAFRPLARRWVLGGMSNLFYQFGDVPEFSTVTMGGPGTLRGHPNGRFRGRHRWIGTLEARFLFLPRKVFHLPKDQDLDVGLGTVLFLDSGIVWNGTDDFKLGNFHGTVGFGVRLYSAIQDVLRFDVGFSAGGAARAHVGTGIRF